ncbi:MAG: protein kinase [Oligoflexia bacterium]|nr:protein kinase [Oligoflexia bacterium]
MFKCSISEQNEQQVLCGQPKTVAKLDAISNENGDNETNRENEENMRAELEKGKLISSIPKVDGRATGPIIHGVVEDCIGNGIKRFYEEYFDNGSLKHFDSTDAQSLTPAKLGEIFLRIMKQLQGMYDNGYVHLDVKDDNILLGGDGSSTIADFGTATPIDGYGRLPADKIATADKLCGTQGLMDDRYYDICAKHLTFVDECYPKKTKVQKELWVQYNCDRRLNELINAFAQTDLRKNDVYAMSQTITKYGRFMGIGPEFNLNIKVICQLPDSDSRIASFSRMERLIFDMCRGNPTERIDLSTAIARFKILQKEIIPGIVPIEGVEYDRVTQELKIAQKARRLAEMKEAAARIQRKKEEADKEGSEVNRAHDD